MQAVTEREGIKKSAARVYYVTVLIKFHIRIAGNFPEILFTICDVTAVLTTGYSSGTLQYIKLLGFKFPEQFITFLPRLWVADQRKNLKTVTEGNSRYSLLHGRCT